MMGALLLNHALLPLLPLLAAAPFVIHLLARRNPPVKEFSSVEFLLRIMKEIAKLRKPQDRLLLAIRTLFAISLASLFLLPVVFPSGKGAAFQRNNLVVVVDATASMAFIEGAQTRFADACAKASETLSGLGGGDSANVVWLKARPSAAFPSPGVNFAYLKDLLRKAQVTSEAGDIASALRLAAGMLKEVEGRKQICVISDFQRTAWANCDMDIPSDIELIKMKAGSADAPNIAVTALNCDSTHPQAGVEAGFTCELSNFSPQPRQATLIFNAEESRSSRELSLPPQGRATVIFKHKFQTHGIFPVKVSLAEGDAFPGDDSRALCVSVAKHLKAGIYAGDQQTAKYWRRALDAIDWMRTESAGETGISCDAAFDILMLAGWNGEGAARIAERLRKGATVVCMPAAGLELAEALRLAEPDAANPSKAQFALERTKRPHKLKIENGKDAMFKLFESGDSVDPASGLFTSRLRIPTAPPGTWETVLSYDDGAPALARCRMPGAGTLFLWLMPLGREAGNWQAQPGFLPFLSEMLLSSRSSNGAATSSGETLERHPGEELSLKAGREAILSDIILKDESDATLPLKLEKDGANSRFISEPIAKPGIYHWKDRGRDRLANAVNFPTQESDLAAMSAESAGRNSASLVAASGGDVKRMRNGIELWPFLLALCVLLLFVEGCVSCWAEQGRREASI